VLCSLVLNKIAEVEALGGVEAVARMAWGSAGIWGDMQVRRGPHSTQ
jgi:histidinol dehydrogenase